MDDRKNVRAVIGSVVFRFGAIADAIV